MTARISTRWASLALAVAAALALGACGDNDDGPIPQTGIRRTTTAPSTTTTTAESTTTTAPASTTTTTQASTTTTAPAG